MTSAITRFRGDTVADIFVIKNSTGAAVDITGCSFKFTLNTLKAPIDALAQVYQLNGTILDAPAGKVSFSPSAVQADRTPGKYYYDVQMTDAGGVITTIVLDSYTYVQDITK